MRIDLTRTRVVADLEVEAVEEVMGEPMPRKRCFFARLATATMWLLLLAGLSACEGKVFPLNAQAGSTVAVPISDAAHLDTFGYGFSYEDQYGVWQIEDLQRGEMFFKLEDAAQVDCPHVDVAYMAADMASNPQCYLMASGAIAAVAAEASLTARYGGSSGRQFLAEFGIPPDTEPGTYDLELYRRMPKEDGSGFDTPEPVVAQDVDPPRTLTVLPHQFDPDLGWLPCGD